MKKLRNIVLTLLTLSIPAYALVTVIPDGPAAGSQSLPNPGDVLIVEEGGSITPVAAADGAIITEDNQTVLNQGSITTSGDGAVGIITGATNNNAVITNSGLISTTGGGGGNHGILSQDDNAVITNNGEIFTVGTTSSGINHGSDNVVITNTGLISTTGATTSNGIFVLGESHIIINRGRILTTNDDSNGIRNGNSTFGSGVANSGLISTQGLNSRGISSTDANIMIANSGQISTEGGNAQGIRSTGANVTMASSGQISTTGDDSHGIENGGVGAVITSSGRILTTGDDSHGIFNDGSSTNADNGVITNSGRISTTGSDAYGIFNDSVGVSADNTMITNSGRISTIGPDAFGINNAGGSNIAITNSGQISTAGSPTAHGILNSGDFAVITNSGQISTTGDLSTGIVNSSADNVVITNSGQISATAVSSNGIAHVGNNIHIINSGTIRSVQASALSIGGTTPTLSLLRGSNLQGRVRADGDPLALNVQTGLNLALTLNPGTFASFGITAPFAVLGQVAGVIDPTGLALQPDVVADLSDTILDGIYRRRASLTCPCLAYGSGVWAQGLGSTRTRSRGSKAVGYDNWQGGFLMGYDTICGGGNIGLFGGATYGEAEVDQQTQKADFSSYIGGVAYERLFCNTFFGMACAVGYVNWDNVRFVMNNLAPGGVDAAKANTDGIFVSPEATLAHRFVSLGFKPLVSFTFRYAGLFLGDYAEQGSLTNLSVQDRDIDLLTSRLELALPLTNSCGACCLNAEPYIGFYQRSQVGGKRVDGQLLGQQLSFDPGGPHNLAALLVGFRGMHSFQRLNLFANLEASFDNRSSARFLGEGGLGFTF